MAKQAVELMFGAYRRELLAQLLLRPDEDFHLRELERMTGIPAGSLHRELKALFEAGLLLKERQGNQVRYQANRASPVYEELASIFRKTVGLAGVLSDALTDLSGTIDLAFVFGSLAVGRQKYSSDVDLMIIGDISLLEAVKALASAQVKLGREINPVVMTAGKFGSQAEKKERFISRVVEEPKIFVVGDANDFTKLAEHGAAG
jgi:predicted nucleotidyltransferase